MTDPSGINLNRARLHRLLAAVGSAPVEPPTSDETDATPYDWHDPHYFNEDQRNRLAAMMSQVAAILSERCAHFFNTEFNVAPAAITQHFANDLSRHIDMERGFSLSFGPDAKPPCGFLAIDADVATDWVTHLLGDSESERNPDRVFSALEQSLLSNLVGAMAEAFLGSLKPHQDLRSKDEVVRGPVAIAFEPTEPICKIVFHVSRTQAEPASEVTFVAAGAALAPVVGKAIPAKTDVPLDELAHLLMEHVHRMSVPITARLGSTRLSFEEVLDLAPGDILLIDKPLDEPVDLILHNQTVFRGRPAQSAGQYAVFITECAAGPDRHRHRDAK